MSIVHTSRFLLSLLLATALLTAGEEGGEEPRVHEEQMTVTAEKTPLSVREATTKVTVINSEELENQLANDVRDLVRYEPGVTVSNDGSRLGYGDFTIRGIGGNRVLTLIDGVSTADRFLFGPFEVNRYTLDLDTLDSVEIVRGASSSLYGSDALGGVVSFVTKDPIDYLRGADNAFRFRSGYDGKNEGIHLGLVGAVSRGRFEGMLQVDQRNIGELQNQGGIETTDATRTAHNPIDSDIGQYLFKGVWRLAEQNRIRVTAELFDADTQTDLYTAQGTSVIFGEVTEISNATADDTRQRFRFSVDQSYVTDTNAVFDQINWQVYATDDTSDQLTTEQRTTRSGATVASILRTGNVDFSQEAFGFDIDFRKQFRTGTGTYQLIYGAAYDRSRFGQFRDRHDLDLQTGDPDAYVGSLVFPSRYFPLSDVIEQSAFVQLEASFLDRRLRLVPGFRYDRIELDPDQNDTIYIDGNPGTDVPVGQTVDEVSPKIGGYYQLTDNLAVTAQFAKGFRAPPYSSVNNGFTNAAGGYQTLPNPNLVPEQSENREVGLRLFGNNGSLSASYFDNAYDDFIQDTVFVGVSQTGISLFQAQNIDEVSISGFELAGDLRLDRNWSLRGAFAELEGTDETSGAPLEFIEPRQLVLGSRFRSDNGRFGSELSATFTDEKSAADVVDPDNSLFLSDSYTLLDLTGYWNIGDSFRLHAGAFNLTDETYYVWTDIVGRSGDDPTLERYSSPGRTFSMNLSYQW